MTLLGRDLSGGAGVEAGDPDVVDGHLGVVLLAPLDDVLLVEPLVVGRHEVDPLEDPELLPGGVRSPGDDDVGAEAGGHRARAGGLDEVTASYRSTTHTLLLPFFDNGEKFYALSQSAVKLSLAVRRRRVCYPTAP